MFDDNRTTLSREPGFVGGEIPTKESIRHVSSTSKRAGEPSLRDGIVETLKSRILTGELPGNSRLHERNLSVEFGVSRVPIREAIFILESQGFAHSKPRIGAFVKPITRKDADELFDVLAALEPLAASLAATHRDEKDLVVMRELLAAAECAIKAGDNDAGSAANAQFHLAILQAGRSDLLNSILSPIQPQTHRLFRHMIVDIADELYHSHQKMFQALLAGDAGEASTIARRHALETRMRGAALFQ